MHSLCQCGSSHLDVLHGYAVRDVSPQAQPFDMKAGAGHDAVQRLYPHLGHDLVQATLGS